MWAQLVYTFIGARITDRILGSNGGAALVTTQVFRTSTILRTR